MTFLSWIIVIVILGLVGRWLTHNWELRRRPVADPPANADTAAAETQASTARATQLTNSLRDGFASLRTSLFGQKQPPLTPQFRIWLAQVLVGEPQLYQWLMALSDEQLDVLTAHISTFCHEMGFDLKWVIEQTLASQPTLTQGLNRVVIHYCQACYQSVVLQEDLEPYRLLRQYEQNPNSPQNRELGQAIFEKFAEKGLATMTPAELQALPEQARREQIVATVRQAAAEQQALLLRLIKELSAPPAAVTTAPAATQLNGATGKTHA